MTVFACAGCGAVLSAPVRRVALPVHARQKWGNGVRMPVLMAEGTYAVEPEPSGPPWEQWDELSTQAASLRGIFAPVYSVSFGKPGAIVIAPGDTRGTVFIPERLSGYCCGLDGGDGPNLACIRCGRPVASRIDDCSLWQAVWFAPDAVRTQPADDVTDRPADWADMLPGAPPVEESGEWSPVWAAAVGACLAHLLAVSDNATIAVPQGLCEVLFGHTLRALLPGALAKTAALAGPGMPAAPTGADILLVPQHPGTGAPWQPAVPTATAPLPAEIWAHLAAPPLHARLVHSPGSLPAGAWADIPAREQPRYPFHPDPRIFLSTLARLPAVRRPWLRAIHDRIARSPYSLFS